MPAAAAFLPTRSLSADHHESRDRANRLWLLPPASRQALIGSGARRPAQETPKVSGLSEGLETAASSTPSQVQNLKTRVRRQILWNALVLPTPREVSSCLSHSRQPRWLCRVQNEWKSPEGESFGALRIDALCSGPRRCQRLDLPCSPMGSIKPPDKSTRLWLRHEMHSIPR